MNTTGDVLNGLDQEGFWRSTLPAKPSQLPCSGKDWSWRRDQGAEPAATYYEATLAESEGFDPLQADLSCDVVVVGAGLLGLSTALHLSELGLAVVVVDSSRIGSGASGRNGGQLTPGLARWEAEDMIHHFDLDTAKALWQLTSHQSMALLDELIEKYQLVCDRKKGHLTACVHPGHVSALNLGIEARQQLGDHCAKILDGTELRDYIRSDIYFGALFDSMGGQLHPLALNRGLANAFHKLGGEIFENTHVDKIEKKSDAAYIHCKSGTIKANKAVVIAAHYRTQSLMEKNKHTAFPFHTYIGVTEPLPIPVAQCLPADMPVYDTQIQIDYYRAVRENRLLFGGQGTGACLSQQAIDRYLKTRLRTVFPSLGEVRFDFLWSGTSDITVNGALYSGIEEGITPVYTLHGWSGHGVAQTLRVGKSVADHITAQNKDFDLLSSIKHKNFIGLAHYGSAFIPMVKFALKLKQKIKPESLISF